MQAFPIIWPILGEHEVQTFSSNLMLPSSLFHIPQAKSPVCRMAICQCASPTQSCGKLCCIYLFAWCDTLVACNFSIPDICCYLAVLRSCLEGNQLQTFGSVQIDENGITGYSAARGSQRLLLYHSDEQKG